MARRRTGRWRARVSTAGTSTNGAIDVRLGHTSGQGVAPSMFVWLERGVGLRPEVAREIRGRVTFRWEEDIAPLSVHFGPEAIDVFDGDVGNPDLAVSGRLPDVVHMATAPLLLGIPNPASRHGLAAILGLYRGRVALEGDLAIARRLIQLLAL